MSSTGDRLAPGTRIGDYRIEREVRTEETGVVYEGVHRVLPRRTAIKVLHADRAWMKSMAIQMLREACVLEALSHPGVPRVFECGVLADKRPWVALEMIEGASLADATRDTPIAISDLGMIVRAVADILAHAHARGVVHHRLGESIVVLTPRRASPVCVRGWGDVVAHDSQLAADPSSDVHALGALAFRALTRTALTAGASAQAACPEAPADLTKLIDDMLADDPKRRPTAAEVSERADWLAETLEGPRSARPSATPAHGIAIRPAVARTPTPDFAVRIRG
jgi:serine/threonine protein kinase